MMENISKAKVKLFSSLQVKKYRQAEQLYAFEGIKMLREALATGTRLEAVVLAHGLELPADLSELLATAGVPCYQADAVTFKRLSHQQQPEGVLGIAPLPGADLLWQGDTAPADLQGPAIVLDRMRDPGNLGTVLRIADWFGFPNVICSADTVDVLNPKVLRSSMGAAFRIRVGYLDDLYDWLGQHATQCWIADMEGQPVTGVSLAERPYLVIGNEAQGLPDRIRQLEGIGRVTIPGFGQAESLNAAMATAILAHEYRRS